MKHHASTPLHKITLYQFKGFDMGEFIKQYLYIITPHETIDENTLSVYKPAEMKMSEARRGAKDENIITCKCMYLQDAIVRRAYAKADSQTFSLSSTILKEVIGLITSSSCQNGLRLKHQSGIYQLIQPEEHLLSWHTTKGFLLSR